MFTRAVIMLGTPLGPNLQIYLELQQELFLWRPSGHPKAGKRPGGHEAAVGRSRVRLHRRRSVSPQQNLRW